MAPRRGTKRRPRRAHPSLEFDSRDRPRRGRRAPSRGTHRGSRAKGGSTSDWLRHGRSRTSTRTEIVHLQQYFQGLRVYRTAVVSKTRPGKRPRVSSGGVTIGAKTRTEPRVAASRALDAAIASLQRRRAVPGSLRPRVLQESRFDVRGMPTSLICRSGFSEPVRAHLEVFPIARGRARLGWVLEIAPVGRPRCEVVVSADTSRPVVLFSHRVTSCLNFNASWVTFPGDAAVAAAFPLPPFTAPMGHSISAGTDWLDAAGIASGPNVSCHVGTKKAADSLAGAKAQNAFVWCNLIHDFFASFGFDSSLAAFDSGDDELQVRVFDSKTEIGGFFDNKVDGSSPQMELFAPPSSSGVHAALDPSILIHEYTHGVSNRLLGGTELASPFAGREAQGLNEGYSDYFALTVLSFLDRAGGGGHPPLRQIGSGFKPGNGLRDYAGFNQTFSSNLRDEYELAMVWCAGLLDAQLGLTGLGLTPDKADRFLWQALLDSLRGMAPTCPRHNCLTFAHAKDALLTASREMEATLPAFLGATNAIGAALSGRGIA